MVKCCCDSTSCHLCLSWSTTMSENQWHTVPGGWPALCTMRQEVTKSNGDCSTRGQTGLLKPWRVPPRSSTKEASSHGCLPESAGKQCVVGHSVSICGPSPSLPTSFPLRAQEQVGRMSDRARLPADLGGLEAWKPPYGALSTYGWAPLLLPRCCLPNKVEGGGNTVVATPRRGRAGLPPLKGGVPKSWGGGLRYHRA